MAALDANSASDATRGVAAALAAGHPYFSPPVKPLALLPRVPSPSPVRAPVFVLTDLGCASVCIGFVDELKRFPGVRQIGVDTFVDNRTGMPIGRTLSSGAATIRVPGDDA